MSMVAALAAVTLVASGCGFAGNDSKKDDAKSDTVKIGFIGPMTGEYSLYGTVAYNAAQLAAEQWNAKGGIDGKQIKLLKGDSQGSPSQAATLARSFVDQGVVGVVGPAFTLESETAVPILCAAKIVAISGLADLIPNSPCYFRTSPRTTTAAAYSAKILTDVVHAKRVAIIDDGKADTRSTTKLVQANLKGKADVVFAGSVTGGQQDYSAALTKVKTLHPDAVFLSTGNPETAILRKQGTDLGLNATWVANTGNSDSDEFKKLAAAKGALTTSFTPTHSQADFDKFSSEYKAKFGKDPEGLAEYSYDAANIMFTAINDAKSTSYDAIVKQLHALKTFVGTTGPIVFDTAGDRGGEVYQLLQYQKDEKWNPLPSVLSAG